MSWWKTSILNEWRIRDMFKHSKSDRHTVSALAGVHYLELFDSPLTMCSGGFEIVTGSSSHTLPHLPPLYVRPGVANYGIQRTALKRSRRLEG